MIEDSIHRLYEVSPELAEKVASVIAYIPELSEEALDLMVENSIWALSRELAFGNAVGSGYILLIQSGNFNRLLTYGELIRNAGQIGETMGRLMATHLVPVLINGDGKFLDRFLSTVRMMNQKGSHTLHAPLEALSALLNAADTASASAYLDLIRHTFAQELSYTRSLDLCNLLPKSALSFNPITRFWQIEQLARVANASHRLIDAFLDGMPRGLRYLSRDALASFISKCLEKYPNQPKIAIAYLSLESGFGMNDCARMQHSAHLDQVQPPLNRYLQARCSLPLSIRSMNSLPESWLSEADRNGLVCSDGTGIYLPEEIGIFPTRDENFRLYKSLVKFEAGYYEFGTYYFDIEKLSDRVSDFHLSDELSPEIHELEQFFRYFENRQLAADLLTIFEHGRIRLLFERYYPGIIHQDLPILRTEAIRNLTSRNSVGILTFLYAWIALGISDHSDIEISEDMMRLCRMIQDCFQHKMRNDSSIETSAELVLTFYSPICDATDDVPLTTPFGRYLRPQLFFLANRDHELTATRLKTALKQKGIDIYKSDIYRILLTRGTIRPDDLKDMIKDSEAILSAASLPELADILRRDAGIEMDDDSDADSTFWYREWNVSLQDYLTHHVRLLERQVLPTENNFYNRALQRYESLVRHIRNCFELLKPEGLTRLRRWVEGDDFDYRALIDYAVDIKTGETPSDRLYIKRIKQQRDVAVMLLVDMSRSTGNPVGDGEISVLDVEKEAIVLFCEALKTVGDQFAIAGFSGTGRLNAEYFKIKDFHEPVNDAVKQRIGWMHPQRSTRMGAAIRHAAIQLEAIPARVRLLIVLGDGFPNDLDYKNAYAIEDTRRAVQESQSKQIHTRGITVNLPHDPDLDALYGSMHHVTISDVQELPRKLFQIYRALAW